MGWIRERIKAEKRKHHDAPFGQLKRDMDWARIAEGKIVMSIMEWCWKHNTVPYADLHNLDCECGHSLFEHIDMDIKSKSGAGCNNKFCVCPKYKKKDIKSKACIASTDGGWVNCMKIHEYIEGHYFEEKKGCGKKMGNSTCGLTQIWDVENKTMTRKFCEECLK